jgi:hypothetical protein
MKIASSSASFDRALAARELTQLEWLDLCAAELELDGVVFDAAHFPRTDADYLAQLKKTAVDLGLTVAGLHASTLLAGAETNWLDLAAALGAPLAIFEAPQASDDPAAWSAFCAALKTLASAAKRANVALALRNDPTTLCASIADCKRVTKDVDSAWLRFALAADGLSLLDRGDELVHKTVIATYRVAHVATFALGEDAEAHNLIGAVRGFRGFVAIDRGAENGARDAFHAALERFRSIS